MLLTDNIDFNKIYFRNKVYERNVLWAGVDEVVSWLNSHCKPGFPIVYLVSPNHIKTVLAYFGIIKSGRTVLLVDPKIGKLEYDEMLEDTPPVAVFRIDTTTLSFDFDHEVELRSNPAPLDDELDNVCTMLYTNADDGYAKAAMLTHENMLANAAAIGSGNKVVNDSLSCALIPFDHLFGFQTGVLAPLVMKQSLVIGVLESPTEMAALPISSAAQLLDDLKVTHLYSVPIIYYLLNKTKQIDSISRRLVSAISGGYSLSPKVHDYCLKKSNLDIREGYGLTEASPVCTWNFPDNTNRVGSVGKAISCCSISILSQGKPVQVGEIGDIYITGKNVMKGYYHKPDYNKLILQNGILYTGDIGKLDSEGFLYLTGLKKNMINHAGKKIYPQETQRHILKNPSVTNIEISSHSDDLQGDVPVYKVTFKEYSEQTKKMFKDWCYANISGHKLSLKTILFQ